MSLENKNNLVINNEHIFKKYFPNIGELARLSNLRIEIEKEFLMQPTESC